ncbi:MAG: DUF2268 domain-containing putative Zn-dependent protease [Candidatus Pacearchaeota archaeon]
MERKNVKIRLKDGNLDVKTFSFLDRISIMRDKDLFLDQICEDIETLKEKDHFGGCMDKEDFRHNLTDSLFKDEQVELFSGKINLSEMTNVIEGIFEKIKDLLGRREILIYIFPTKSRFVVESLGGVWGLLAWDDILHIFINPVQNWELNLKSTILHELAHCLQDYYSYDMTLFEHLVADGLAEHFQKGFLDDNRNSFTKVVSRNEAKKILKELKSFLDKTMNDNPGIHSDLFFGGGKYVSGTGYTIGYYLIEDYLEKNKNISWKQLLKKKSEEFRQSPFFI